MENKYIQYGPELYGSISDQSFGVILYDSLQKHLAENNPALLNVESGESISYKELFSASCALALNLRSLGISKDQHVAISAENRIDFFIPIISSMYIGSAIAPINHTYTERELLHSLDLVKPTLVFCTNSTLERFKNLQARGQISYVQHLMNLDEDLADPKIIDCVDFEPQTLDEIETAVLMFSSGTTGLPKAVMITHRNLNTTHNLFLNPRFLLAELTNILLIVPFYHVYGFITSIVSLIIGNTIKFLPKFNDKTYLSCIQQYKINFLTLVPPLMVFFAKSPLIDNYDLSCVKYIICAGAPLPKDVQMVVQKRLNNPEVCQAYGLTESTFSIISMPNNCKFRDGSIGKPDPGAQIKIRDIENGHTLGPNQFGELCCKSAMIMKGYYRNPEATQISFTDDGWLLTGDLAYFDDDGYFYIVDRLKELIKYKGYQVPPAELEALLLAHSKIDDAAVVGLPDEEAGEVPIAFVVRKPNVELTEQEVKDFVKELVSFPKQLRGGVKFVDLIPKSPSGKILRKDLRQIVKNFSRD